MSGRVVPRTPEQVTVDDAIDALYCLGVSVVMPNAPEEADLPRLVGALIYAVDSLQAHKQLFDDEDVRAIVRGWIEAAGGEEYPVQALAMATMRANLTASVLQRFSADGPLYVIMRSAALALSRFMSAAGLLETAHIGGPPPSDDEMRKLLREGRADLRNAIAAYEALRKQLRAMGGHEI